MQDRLVIAGGDVVAHGAAPYPGAARRGLLLSAALLFALLLPANSAHAEPPVLKAAGTPRRFEVEVAGGEAVFRFSALAGCRYRLTAQPGSLPRPILELGRAGEEPFARADAGSSGQSAVHIWDAERSGPLEVHVGGFSAQVGDGRIKLETLNSRDEPVRAHRRFLWPGPERARVGELLLGESNRWELTVEEGKAYEITPTQGSAGRVRMRIYGWLGELLADSQASGIAWVARPPVRFAVPARAAAVPAPPDGAPKKPKRSKGPPTILLEVRGLLDGGGTYGVRLRELGDGEEVAPPEVTPPEAVERGPVEGQPQTFRAGSGDVALLYVPRSPQRSQVVEMLRGTTWIRLDDMGLSGSARSQEDALIVWFRPYYPGTYRFRGVPAPPPSRPRLMLHDRATLGSAPLHMGTGADPQVRARLKSSWTLVGLGVCMPGWDYLYVCVDGPDQGIAMRVRSADGKTVRTRGAGDRSISPGLGPSLRFRAPRAGVYRLEAKNGRKRVIRPLLRRASN